LYTSGGRLWKRLRTNRSTGRSSNPACSRLLSTDSDEAPTITSFAAIARKTATRRAFRSPDGKPATRLSFLSPLAKGGPGGVGTHVSETVERRLPAQWGDFCPTAPPPRDRSASHQFRWAFGRRLMKKRDPPAKIRFATTGPGPRSRETLHGMKPAMDRINLMARDVDQ
jgi:hypothetical protein